MQFGIKTGKGYFDLSLSKTSYRSKPMIFGFQIDLARKLERPEILIKKLRTMGRFNYNLCMLYLEDAFVYETHPGISRQNAISVKNMSKIYEVCRNSKMELVPVIPALGHCGFITRKKDYEHYDEGYGTGKILDTLRYGEEETYKLLKELFSDWCSNIPGRYIHVGLDESPSMGQTFIRKNGIEKLNAAKVFAEHCNNLNIIVKSLGRKMVAWGDMLYHFPAAVNLIDKDIIICDWFYYKFDFLPKVEVFNFADVDLTGILKNAGFKVWGIPSVWPNLPLGDIRDRLENLKSWFRYGKAKNIDGIINTDWENCFGFYVISDMLFKCFGKMYKDNFGTSLEKALQNTIEEITGCRVNDSFIDDLLSLGKFHICGHGDRKALKLSLASRISTQKVRQNEYREKTMKLEHMFQDIDEFLNEASNPELLEAIKISHEMLLLFWKTGNDLSSICSTPENAFNTLRELIGKYEKFLEEYMKLWNTLRYEDEDIPIRDWCENSIEELEQVIDELKTISILKSSLINIPRLELELECRHPSLPVLDIFVKYSNKNIQSAREIMIKFESEYAVPNKVWRQYPVIPLEGKELPETIKFESRCYGQVGIVNAWVIYKGKRLQFLPAETEGTNVCKKDGILWLGPISATSDSPTRRTEKDSAIYFLSN